MSWLRTRWFGWRYQQNELQAERAILGWPRAWGHSTRKWSRSPCRTPFHLNCSHMEFLTKHPEHTESWKANSNASEAKPWWKPTAKPYAATKTNLPFFCFLIFLVHLISVRPLHRLERDRARIQKHRPKSLDATFLTSFEDSATFLLFTSVWSSKDASRLN